MEKDYKHLNVVHKPSNKIVSIFQFTNDATWIGRERDQLIALENPRQRLLTSNENTKFYKSLGGKDGESGQSKIT